MVETRIVARPDSLANGPRRNEKSYLPITEGRIFRFEILERRKRI